MKILVKQINTDKERKIEISKDVFDIKVSDGAIYHAIRNELANRRLGTASTKGRSEVKASNRKPWRQKGTGRARAGDRKSPLWVGGGTVFGPKPRSYRYKLPRKVKRLALISILTQKYKDEKITVVEGIDVKTGKTKDLYKQLSPVTEGKRSVLLMATNEKTIVRAGRNIPWLKVQYYETITAHDLFYCERLLLTPEVVLKIEDKFASNKKDQNNISEDPNSMKSEVVNSEDAEKLSAPNDDMEAEVK